MVTESEILKLVRSRRYSPMTARDIAAKFNIPEAEREQFDSLVREMELAGEIVEVKQRCLADPARVDLLVGTLLCNPRGFGFIKPARAIDGEDIHISGESMSSAMHGDIVVARIPTALRRGETRRGVPVKRGRRGRRWAGEADLPEVKIVNVLQRARTEVVGTFRCENHVCFVVPDDPRLFRDVVVAAEDTHDAKPNDKVAVRITIWPSRHINPAGEVVDVFGPRGEMEAERLSVIREFGLRSEFPEETLRRAGELPAEVPPADLADRQDLTAELIFTVDPEDARDFDDAVSLRRLPGGWELGVHIADVSHYVKPEDAIDSEARLRGTSVYLPGQVIPMLPEKLSNGLCSLMPHVIRLTKTVRMRFDAEGHLTGSDAFSSYIRSARRFNYKEVQQVIDGGRLTASEAHIRENILLMHELAGRLRDRRREAGMLQLDIPEAHILTDDKGRTIGVELRASDASHGLIEQFMLAANEAVANYLLRHKLPYICRAHDEPDTDALQAFRDTASALGHNLPAPGTRHQLQKFLDRIEGKPESHVLHYLLLRSMKLAVYSSEDKPHYAIAAEHYLHFTSPIRRYPDLLAHRILQEHWSGRMREPGRRDYWLEGLPKWALRSSDTEHKAEMAERSITTRRLLDFVAARQSPMPALITAVENYGLRVQLCEFLLDGIIRMSALSDGFYRVNRERRTLTGPGGKQFRVGQTIQVRVLRYDEFKHQIEFEPVRKR